MGPKAFLEYSSKELLALAKKETPKRYQRRLEIGPTRVIGAEIDFDKTGNAIIYLETNKHTHLVEIENFVDLVADEIIEKHGNQVTREELMKIVNIAVRLLLESGDILIDCDCEDYKYRFNWLAKQYGYAKKDRIIGYDYAPDIANPGKIGAFCKHTIKGITRQSEWGPRASRILINIILKNKELRDIEVVDIRQPEPEPELELEEEILVEEPVEVEELDVEEELDGNN